MKQDRNVQEVKTHNQQNNSKNKEMSKLAPYIIIRSFAAKLSNNKDSNMDSRDKKGINITMIKQN